MAGLMIEEIFYRENKWVRGDGKEVYPLQIGKTQTIRLGEEGLNSNMEGRFRMNIITNKKLEEARYFSWGESNPLINLHTKKKYLPLTFYKDYKKD